MSGGGALTTPGRLQAVRAGQFVVQRLVAELLDLGGFLLGVLPLVQDRRVVELDERVDEQLPVAADLGAVGVGLGHLAERVALDALGQWTQVVDQWRRVVVEVDEDEAFPHLAADRRQAVAALVEVEELVLLLDEREVAVQAVPPGVVLAGELPAGSGGLLVGKVVPHQLVSAVPADVVVRLDRAVLGLDDDHRGTGSGRGQFPGEVAAGARQPVHPSDVEPLFAEHRFALGLEERRVDRVAVVDRVGPQLGIILCPAAGSCLGKWANVLPFSQSSVWWVFST